MHPLPPYRAESPRVAIVGAGPIGCAAAAYLTDAGHKPALWSPTASRIDRRSTGSARFDCIGALDASIDVELLASAESLAHFDAVLICLPATAYETVLEPLNGIWTSAQHILVSGALSLVPLWIEQACHSRGEYPVVAAWGTTLTTAHFRAEGQLHVNPIRKYIDLAARGDQGMRALATCEALFGPRFGLASSLLVPALANINPIAHAAEVIPNLTRMEMAQQWSLFGHFGTVVSRLANDLDAERISIARALGFEVPSLQEHYARSYHLDHAPLHEIAAGIVARGMSPDGPATLMHRYVLEDAPFGLVFLEALARGTATAAPVLTACIELLQSAYARDFRAGNFLLGSLGIGGGDLDALVARCAAVDKSVMREREAARAR